MLSLAHITKRYAGVVAVDDITLDIPKGEFFSFLGPSGCGKTTLLRMVSGFTEPTQGTIRINGQDLAGVAPHKRPTALIFQNLALFPLMSVADNIAYGLRVRGVPAAERRRKADALLDLIALPGYGGKRIDELSGGQKQRVAVARALAVEPAVLLLDEPLSALDLKLRQHMRSELRNLQRRSGITFIYITHDQGEALAMSDRVAVMSNGRIEQIGLSTDIYNHPKTPFVASFVGENNAFDGRVLSASKDMAVFESDFGAWTAHNPHSLAAGAPATLFVRPERFRVTGGGATDNVLQAEVADPVFEGLSLNVLLRRAGTRPLAVSMPNDGSTPVPAPGVWLRLTFSAGDALVLPRGPMA